MPADVTTAARRARAPQSVSSGKTTSSSVSASHVIGADHSCSSHATHGWKHMGRAVTPTATALTACPFTHEGEWILSRPVKA